MKKIFLLLSLLFTIVFSAQEQKEAEYPQDIGKKHELKINAFSLIAFTSLDITYEHLLNKDSSFGVGIFYNFNDVDDDLYFPKKFSITPYYRWFFTESKFARGFFVEGFGSLNTYEELGYYFNSNSREAVSETDFALGVSVGGKFIIKSGFVAEIYLGVGRNLFNNGSESLLENSLITRGGISLGYRF